MRQHVTWSCLLGFVLFGVLFVCSRWLYVSYEGSSWAIGLQFGVASAGYVVGANETAYDDEFHGLSYGMLLEPHLSFGFRWKLSPRWSYVWIPLWVPTALCALVVLLGLRKRNPKAGKPCEECGYDLTGNVSGRCPECGVSLHSGAAASGLH